MQLAEVWFNKTIVKHEKGKIKIAGSCSPQ